MGGGHEEEEAMARFVGFAELQEIGYSLMFSSISQPTGLA